MTVLNPIQDCRGVECSSLDDEDHRVLGDGYAIGAPATDHRSAARTAGLISVGLQLGSAFTAGLAEDRGFEPLRELPQHAFQACAIGH